MASVTLRDRAPVALARATWQTSKPLAIAWWGLVLIRGVVPAALTLGLGALLRAQRAAPSSLSWSVATDRPVYHLSSSPPFPTEGTGWGSFVAVCAGHQCLLLLRKGSEGGSEGSSEGSGEGSGEGR